MSKKNRKLSKKAIPFALNIKNNERFDLLSGYENEKVEMSSAERNKIIENVFKSGKIRVNKNTGETTIFFEDGKSKVYNMEDIIDSIEMYRQDIMKRFGVIMDAYVELYIDGELVQDENFKQKCKVDELITELYDKYAEEGKTQDYRKEGIGNLYKMFLCEDLTLSTLILEFIKNNYQSVFEEDIIKQVRDIELENCKYIEKLAERGGGNILYRYVNELINKNSETNKRFTRQYGAGTLPDESIISILNNILGREHIKDYMREYGVPILDRKRVINYLTDKQIIKKEEIPELIDNNELIKGFFKTKNPEFLKYIDKKEIVALYGINLIDLNLLKKYADVNAILTSNIEKDKKIEILMSDKKNRIFNNDETSLIWEYFEKDYFSLKDIKALEKAGYMRVDTVIKNYYEDQKRKIAVELGEIPAITDEKIHSFFTPDIVLRDLKSKIQNDEKKKFYNEDLKNIYAKFEDDLEKGVSDNIKKENEDDKKKCDASHLSLYCNGFFSIGTLGKSEISKEAAIKYYNENNCNSKILIDFFNNGILLQDEVYELCGDDFDNKVLELISNGMNPTIISGLYSTKELIEMVREGKLDCSSLAKLKSDIIIGIDETSKGEKTLLEMYLDGNLSYAELYNLVEAGVISMKDANNIDDKYNLRKDIKELSDIGLINIPIDGLCSEKMDTKSIQNNLSKEKSRKNSSGESIGIDRNPIYNFYKALGATNVIKVDPEKCPIFKDEYSLIIIEDKKIGFLESSNGRTYMLPLKIICEQRKNLGGELDIIGNSKSRSQFNQQKEYVRSSNHTRNWAVNVLDKVVDLLPSAMSKEDVKEFKKTNQDLMNAIQMSYDDRKEKRRYR